MSSPLVRRRSVLAIGLAGLLASRLPAFGSPTLQHLRLHIGEAPGSTLDIVARALAAAGRATDPTLAIEIDNSTGAGAKEQLMKDALSPDIPPDSLFAIAGSVVYRALAGDSPVDLKRALANSLGSIGQDRRALLVSTKLGINSFADVLASPTPLVVPTVSAAVSAHIETLLINALTGAKLKPVGGYGSAERKLALLSGEANAVVGSIDTFADLVEQGLLKPVLRLNDAGPDAPAAGQPLLAQFAKGPSAGPLTALIAGVALSNALVVAPASATAADLEQLLAFFNLTASALNKSVPAGIDPSEVIAGDQHTVRTRLSGLLDATDTVSRMYRDALACGADATKCS